MSSEELRQARYGDLTRVAVAWAVAKKTTMAFGWIARELALRSASNASQRVRMFERMEVKELEKAIREWRRNF
ncbi:MAG: hypothetical protein AAF357_08395 [Verrucomicrobiota bacterium]